MSGSRMPDQQVERKQEASERQKTEARANAEVLAQALEALAKQVRAHGLRAGKPFNWYVDQHPVRDIKADIAAPHEGHHFLRTGERTVHLEYWLEDL